MFKILIWDYAGVSEQWLNQVADKDYIDVVDVLTPDSPDKHASEILLKRDAWDWLLIFEQGARKFFDATVQLLRFPLDRVIYALDINSWLEHPKAAFTLINPATESGGAIYRQLNFNFNRQLNNFVTCTAEGISYVGTATDPFRMPYMFVNRINFSSNDMKRFHALAKKYYNVDDSAGCFLDLGANIGTTGIYFIKNIAPKLKLLAFEPDPENFKMHRVNLILNDLDDRATLVNCGLSNKLDELMLYNNGANPGARGFIKHGFSTPIATVKIIPLDSYLAEHNIAAQDVKYIWIDTEGLEAQVMVGAKNLLAENPAPIFAEFNLGAWRKSGCFDELMTLLEGLSRTLSCSAAAKRLFIRLTPCARSRRLRQVFWGDSAKATSSSSRKAQSVRNYHEKIFLQQDAPHRHRNRAVRRADYRGSTLLCRKQQQSG